ncbi:hypothetical protein DSO57_1020811 [Entomophthora muscae]|nr:hypothetical protein DSO57_1020811 [Entomophthora muscae]
MNIDQLEELLVLLDISSDPPSTKPEPCLEEQSVIYSGGYGVNDDNFNLIDFLPEQLDSNLPSPRIISDSKPQAIEHIQDVCLEETYLLEDMGPRLNPLAEPSKMNMNEQHINNTATQSHSIQVEYSSTGTGSDNLPTVHEMPSKENKNVGTVMEQLETPTANITLASKDLVHKPQEGINCLHGNTPLPPSNNTKDMETNIKKTDILATNRKHSLKMNRLFNVALEAAKDGNHLDPIQEIDKEVCVDTSQFPTLDLSLEVNDSRSKFIKITHYSTTRSLSHFIEKLCSFEPGFVVGVAFITPTLAYIELKDSKKAAVANSLYSTYNKQGSSSICSPSKDTAFMTGSRIKRLLGLG